MFEKTNKTTQIQIRCTKQEKELIQLMANRSPQGDVTNWLFHLIKQEYDRVSEFDIQVKEAGAAASTPNFKY